MSSIIQGYEYDIFISYRQKDNKYDGWVTEFVVNLRRELEATFKEDLSIYTDENQKDGLLETHNVDKSLEGKLKSLIFIPIISQTYCDPKSFAWSQEFCAFNKMAKEDQFGRDIKFSNGNVASRILPVKIHDLDPEDKMLLENELGGVLRAVELIYKEAGVNRPLRPTDNKNDNQNKTDYRNQVNKVANAVKEIIGSLKMVSSGNSKPTGPQVHRGKSKERKLRITGKPLIMLVVVFLLIIIIISARSLFTYSTSEESSKNSHKKNITAKPEAYELYMKGEYHLDPLHTDDLDSSIFFLTKAINADPLFALAHAELSRAYSFMNYFWDTTGVYGEKAYMEAEKSLYLDPRLGEGYFARAYCTWNFQNKFPHEKTIREYKKAIALNPDLDEAYHYLGILYYHVGLRQESIEAFSKALKINPNNKIATADFASTYIFNGKKADFEHSIDLFEQMPVHLLSPLRYSLWALALLALDKPDEAENMLSSALKKDPSDLSLISAYAVFLAKKGDKTGALEKIAFCEKGKLNKGHSHHVVYNLAEAYALLGDSEKSVNKLTWAAENGYPNYPYFHDDPLLISLHQFGPYNELLKKLKIKWEKFREVAHEKV
jgi:tetratricopeptide (TPR) repeat protein